MRIPSTLVLCSSGIHPRYNQVWYWVSDYFRLSFWFSAIGVWTIRTILHKHAHKMIKPNYILGNSPTSTSTRANETNLGQHLSHLQVLISNLYLYYFTFLPVLVLIGGLNCIPILTLLSNRDQPLNFYRDQVSETTEQQQKYRAWPSPHAWCGWQHLKEYKIINWGLSLHSVEQQIYLPMVL